MRVRVLSPAIEEIANAALWFDSQAPGLGDELWRAIDAALSQIQDNPRRFGKSDFSTSDLELRFAYVERFHYVVHFAVEPEDVLIVAVTHAARRPGYWLHRMN